MLHFIQFYDALSFDEVKYFSDFWGHSCAQSTQMVACVKATDK